MAWLSVKDFAARKGVSRQSILKSISKYQTKQVAGVGGRGMVYMIWMDEMDEDGRDGRAEGPKVKDDVARPEAEMETGVDDGAAPAPETRPTAQELTIKNEELKIKTAWVPACAGTTAVALVEQEKAEFESHDVGGREKAYARLYIVKAFRDNINHGTHGRDGKERTSEDACPYDGLNKQAIATAFVAKLNLGEICREAWSALGSKPVSIKTIYRWEKLWKESGCAAYPIALIDKKKGIVGRKGIAGIEIKNRIRQLASDPRRLDGTHIIRIIRDEYEECPLSSRSIQHLVQMSRGDRFLVAGMTGPTAYKNLARPHNKLVNDLCPNDLWESDGKTLNNLVLSPFWFHRNEEYRSIIRPVLVAWFDVCSGAITGWAVGSSETFHLVKTAFISAIKRFGIPRMVKTDNGGSYNNIYTNPFQYAYQKRATEAQKKALVMVKSGYQGFYEGLGVEKVKFTIPGNSESKQIEAAWGYALREFEKSQLMYTGEDTEHRPEYMGITKKLMLKRYANQLLTWDDYISRLEGFINQWNNSHRAVLQKVSGETCSPIEMYREFEDSLKRPVRELLEHRDWHPHKVTVQRDGIYINGLWYRHPNFSIYLGRSVLCEYNENNLLEVTIADLDGGKWSQSAKLLVPGSHIDEEQAQLAYAERGRYEKALKAMYAARVNAKDKLTTSELNRLTDSVMNLLTDQGRSQEKDKAERSGVSGSTKQAGFLPTQERLDGRYGRAKQSMDEVIDSLEDEIAACAAVPVESVQEPEPDEDDILIAELIKESKQYGL